MLPDDVLWVIGHVHVGVVVGVVVHVGGVPDSVGHYPSWYACAVQDDSSAAGCVEACLEAPCAQSQLEVGLSPPLVGASFVGRAPGVPALGVLQLHLGVPFVGVQVAGEHEAVCLELNLAAFVLELERVPVNDAEKEVCRHLAVEFFEDERVGVSDLRGDPEGAAAVAVWNDVRVGVLLHPVGALAGARGAEELDDLRRYGGVAVLGEERLGVL